MSTVRTQGVKTEARDPGRWVPSPGLWGLHLSLHRAVGAAERKTGRDPTEGQRGGYSSANVRGQDRHAQDFRDDK